MPSSGIIIPAVAEAAGVRRTYVDRMLRPMRAAGQVPTGQPGKDLPSGQYRPLHLGYLILGFAGVQPHDAAEAAGILGGLVFHHATPHGPKEGRVPGRLVDVVAALIRGTWTVPQPHKMPDLTFHMPDLKLAVAPPWVELIWPDANGHPELTEVYGPEPGKEFAFQNGAVLRETRVRSQLLTTASQLWNSTPEYLRAENEKAAELAGSDRPWIVGHSETRATVAYHSGHTLRDAPQGAQP